MITSHRDSYLSSLNVIMMLVVMMKQVVMIKSQHDYTSHHKIQAIQFIIIACYHYTRCHDVTSHAREVDESVDDDEW